MKIQVLPIVICLGFLGLSTSILFYLKKPQFCISLRMGPNDCGCFGVPKPPKKIEKIDLRNKPISIDELTFLSNHLSALKKQESISPIAQVLFDDTISWQKYISVLDVCNQNKPVNIAPIGSNLFVLFSRDSGEFCFSRFLLPELKTINLGTP